MKKIILLITVLVIGISLNAQTTGILTFTVTTTASGGQGAKHLLAIWIEKADGTFIKTKLKKGNNYINYLNIWVAKSGQNVTDATTGATLSSHTTPVSITWNATDINGNIVPDGDYKLWIQMAYDNFNGPTYSIPFTKGATTVHLTPVNQPNYLNMTLDWTSTSSVIDNSATNFNFLTSPNPFKETSNINFNVKNQSTIKINIYSIEGNLITTLLNETKSTGDYSIKWNGVDKNGNKIVAGIYYVSISDGKKMATRKIIKLN